MKKLICILSILFFSLSVATSQPTKENSFFNSVLPFAVQISKKNNLPLAIVLAQAAKESGWGQTELPTKYNAYFAIKANPISWTGQIAYRIDDDRNSKGELILSPFRAYTSPQESFNDYANFLSNNPRYQKLFSIDKHDYIRWALLLKDAGYATAADYANSLVLLIEKYGLNDLQKQIDMGIEKPYIMQASTTWFNHAVKIDFNTPVQNASYTLTNQQGNVLAQGSFSGLGHQISIEPSNQDKLFLTVQLDSLTFTRTIQPQPVR